MNRIFSWVIGHKWTIVASVVFAATLFYYFQIYKSEETTTENFYAVAVVDRGEVTSGIQTTGKIVAAEKLDIDIYKQQSQIEAVNVQNGGHVTAGTVLVSFDKSDAYVDAQSAKVSVADAALALETATANAGDVNTDIRTLESRIKTYQDIIVDIPDKLTEAYRDFLNTSLEVVSDKNRTSLQSGRAKPVLSGRYVSETTGDYTITVYESSAKSGYSYRVSGLESMNGSIEFGVPVPIGTKGLKLTFSESATRNNDAWVVSVPNDTIATYAEAKLTYENSVKNLDTTKRDTEVSLANALQQLTDLQQADGTDYRNLTVNKAKASLAEAQQRLSQNYDVVQERDIVAPFSGTVEGMENVVVGATPTGGSEDTINLGTLISDQFLTTFTLGAAEVGTVAVGERVDVKVTSLTGEPTFQAKITQISSLPTSDGVAQYEVQALLDYSRASSTVILREGMLADIEVVKEVKSDVLRVPATAVTYENGQAKVRVIDVLTETQQAEVDRLGIVRVADGSTMATYDVAVSVGIRGSYYIEITEGLEEGAIIVTTVVTTGTSESTVEETRMGPPDGGGQQRSGSSGGQTRSGSSN